MAPKLKEHFAQGDEEVPFKSINICGRNIVFPYFSRNKFTASQRSLYDSTYESTNPIGKCRKDAINGIVNESHSLVHENSLFYVLKHSCLGFRINKFDVRDNGKLVYITFNMNTQQDVMNMVNLILLNPLYVEFSLNTENSSVAYRIPSDVQGLPWIFSNEEGIKSYGKEYILPFVAVSDNTKGACDNAFNYKDLSPNQTFVTAPDLQKLIDFNNGVLNLKAYYLDTLINSFQYIGRSLRLDKPTSGSVTIFEKDYQKYYNNDGATQKYEFMNNIALMYSNNINPVFTVCFITQITPGFTGRNMIAKMYMNNSIGKYAQSCADIQDKMPGALNNNIISVAVEPFDNYYYQMHFFTGNSEGCFFKGNNMLSIKLPYLSINAQTKVYVTVTPNEKVVLAHWNDMNRRDVTTKIVFGKKNTCNNAAQYDVCQSSGKQDSTVNNSLYDLFLKNVPGTRTALENITMNFDTSFIKQVESCDLGYVNLFKKIRNQ
jgi:hypothetical protein